MNTRLLVIALFCISSLSAFAQPQTGQFLNASAGFGLVHPYDNSNLDGSGFHAQVEYIWSPLTWLGFRPYAGVIMASGDSDLDGAAAYVIKSNAFLAGGKVRLAAPIPYVSPFVESGIGISLGSFQTFTPETDHRKSGILYHIPLSLGLAVGKRHHVEIKFTYFYHPSVEQFSGAVGAGFTIPVGK